MKQTTSSRVMQVETAGTVCRKIKERVGWVFSEELFEVMAEDSERPLRQSARKRELYLSAEEEKELRDIIRSIEPEQLKNLKELLRATPDILKIVEGKRITAGIYRGVGDVSKWAAGIIALFVAYKQMFPGGLFGGK